MIHKFGCPCFSSSQDWWFALTATFGGSKKIEMEETRVKNCNGVGYKKRPNYYQESQVCHRAGRLSYLVKGTPKGKPMPFGATRKEQDKGIFVMHAAWICLPNPSEDPTLLTSPFLQTDLSLFDGTLFVFFFGRPIARLFEDRPKWEE